MTAKELIHYQLQSSRHMLLAVLNTIPEASLEVCAAEQDMSSIDSLNHLAESYEHLIELSYGRKMAWGKFDIRSLPWAKMLNEAISIRDRALAAVPGDTDEELKLLNLYVLEHELYHIGRLCLIALKTVPDWNPYSIYPQVT
jgi:hypothetical protein